ncbi:MAG: hypothetical protein ACTHOE_04035 [Conexibacter sp.]
MRARRIAALVVAGALVAGMAACGSSSNDGGSGGGLTKAASAPADTTSAATTETTATTTTTTADSSSSASTSGGLTPPGTKLGFGDQATVGWVPPSKYSVNGAQKGYKLQVSVDSIEKGSIGDFKNIDLDADQKRSTPYYVKVTVKALEDVKTGTDDPDISFDAIDDRGQEQGSVTFFGTFERCDDKQVPRPFTNGKSYESCITYLMPGGGSIDEVQWKSGPSKKNAVSPYFDKPIVWSGS